MSFRHSVVFAATALAACKGGLLTDRGNDYPCDFSQPEGARDAVCSPGDVCGVDNLCRQYRYEGPQFELGANPPDFHQAERRHPLVLDQPVTLVTRAKAEGLDRGLALSAGELTLVELNGGVSVRKVSSPLLSSADFTSAAMSHGPTPLGVALLRIGNQDEVRCFTASCLDGGIISQLPHGDRLRTGIGKVAVLWRADDGGFGAVELSPTGRRPIELRIDGGVDGGVYDAPVLELRYLPAVGGAEDELALANEGLFLGQRLISGDELLPPAVRRPGARVELRHDPSGTVAAFTAFIRGDSTVLSSWRIDRGTTPSAVRLWADCNPCRGNIAAFAPTLELGSPSIEVLCSSDAGTLSLLRVTGSAAAEPMQPCVAAPLDAPFPLAEVNVVSRGRRAREGERPFVVFDEGPGAGVTLGGRHGQVWSGTTFTRALPVFLERTPRAFGVMPSKLGEKVPAVFTDRYLALPRDPSLGYEVVDLQRSVTLPDGVVGAAFVGEAPGWGLLSSGDLVQVQPGATDGVVRFGPRLLDARGNPARGPYFGEAATERDGGLISFVLTADDSLYFTPAPPRAQTTLMPDQLPPVTPQLTPSPSAPVRSFALERSALGTDGRSRVRAYVVAGRSLFLVTFDGTPPRWSATALVLQAGEPLEVWMDHPLGGLGRVGYRDGQVFTLPGGFLLVNPLPRDAGTNPPQVLDYENLGGWPVALTSNGLFEAHYPVRDGGFLDNRFPDGGVNKAMNWAHVKLPDGGEPWLGKPARLHVTQQTHRYDGGFTVPNVIPDFVRVFRLTVYTDEQVYEVGTLVRR